MTTERGVTCPACGASTPLPNDLRVPTFSCAFCGASLETSKLAGGAAVSADALLGHLATALANPANASANANTNAPRFEGGNQATREAKCHHCGGPLVVPLAVEVSRVTCGGCGRTEAISEYVSDRERLDLDMARQIAGNQALKALQAEGLECTKCGGMNPVPANGSVQVACRFCGTTMRLADHVDASAVARQRLKHGVFGMRDKILREQEASQRRTSRIIVGVVLGGILLFALVGALSSRM